MNTDDYKQLKQLGSLINGAVKEVEHLREWNLLYKQQLVIIYLNNGKLKDMDYDDLNLIDWDEVNVGIGMTGFSVTVGSYDGRPKPMVKSWADMPLKK